MFAEWRALLRPHEWPFPDCTPPSEQACLRWPMPEQMKWLLYEFRVPRRKLPRFH